MTKSSTTNIVTQDTVIVVIITYICIIKSPVTDQIPTVLIFSTSAKTLETKYIIKTTSVERCAGKCKDSMNKCKSA